MCKRWIFQQSMFDYQRVHVSNRSRKSKLSHCHGFDHIPRDPQLRAISILSATTVSACKVPPQKSMLHVHQSQVTIGHHFSPRVYVAFPRRRNPVPFIWAPVRRRCHGPPRPLPSVRAMGVCVAKPATCRDGPSPQGDGRKSLGAARGGESWASGVELVNGWLMDG